VSDAVGERYRRLLRAIDEELAACGRRPGDVTLVGVAKRQPPEKVAAAIAAGLGDVGENYMQEALHAFAALPPVRKHFIGHLQTNKAKAVAQLFDLVQSVDRPEVASALDRAARALGKRLPVLVQINVSPSERFGCSPEEARGLADAVRALSGLAFEGLMALGPAVADRNEISRAFALAAKTFDRVGGTTLSIGMSDDWREAVRAGSTMVRIGSALFGRRESP
jgi:PLP dependent protein